tara:strand:+ start:4208 stop:6136 length:1929 start_codon:yes stop_codon:yes gene_type:complete
MHKKVYKYLYNYSSEPKIVDRLIVSSFLSINDLTVENNKFLKDYVISELNLEEYECQTDFIELIKIQRKKLVIEDLIELFEFVVSPSDKEVNGAVYTPENIRNYIVNSIFKKLPKSDEFFAQAKFGDISCGCAGFLYTITEQLRKKTNRSYFEIYNSNIYGLDIKGYSVVRSKLLLSLLAIYNGEDIVEFKFNLFKGNALNFDWKNESNQIAKSNGFDAIVGNPPYVGSSKIDDESKSFLKNWKVTKTGKGDLYIPFFEIALENLNERGFLGYITVNSFYRSLNGRALRSYFSENKFDISIIDFDREQLFKGRSTYTCICLIGRQSKNEVKYVKSESKNILKIKLRDFIKIPYEILNDYDGWLLVDEETRKIIYKITSTGKTLGKKFEIRNGFATLKNDIYVFRPIAEDNEYYFLKQGEKKYKIEKKICRNAIKPNILKSENEIKVNTEKIIFPYDSNIEDINLFEEKSIYVKILDEEILKLKYPLAYKYLSDNKKILAKRDKGDGDYDKWYSFGRSQALTYYGFKLFFPYISENPCFVFTNEKDFLFYNGYAILSKNDRRLLILQKILKSKIFWFYIKTISKPYAGGYYSLAKNYLKGFGVCDLTLNEEEILLKLEDSIEIENFLLEKYDLIEHKLIINHT